MKIVFGPVVAPAAWEIGEKLLPTEFKIEILSTDEKRRIDQLETGPLSRASRRHARRVAAACSVQFDGACDGGRLISLAPATACWEDVQPGEAPR